jgi:hypothetical protein
MIAFSLYMLLTMLGIYLNSSVGLKYEAVSKEDIEYIVLYSKVLIIYIILIIVMLFYSFKK